ncbi:rCG37707 [Rattus norvegicus]|uniref:RCG37707 n=1 Tax=Rattus norvegicus TaxID=10116 RepID=A6JEW2_RAT|nr:rCG37707 [Rattus norvegicus]
MRLCLYVYHQITSSF